MTLQGPNISRLDLDRVKRVIDERQAEGIKEGEIAQREEHKDQHLKGPLSFVGFDNIVFDVYTAVQAYLTEKPIAMTGQAVVDPVPATVETNTALNRNVKMSRVIFWTHHLKAPSKKRDMTAWCSELSLWGLVKSGALL